MLRLTRPLLQQALKKSSTGITGLAVHPNPLPELLETYEATLSLLSSLPASSVYRQSVEALTQHKLKLMRDAPGRRRGRRRAGAGRGPDRGGVGRCGR
jgi:NADH dehydrogenase (ubiquinone) 1 alpha subcomplex subunit 5